MPPDDVIDVPEERLRDSECDGGLNTGRVLVGDRAGDKLLIGELVPLISISNMYFTWMGINHSIDSSL